MVLLVKKASKVFKERNIWPAKGLKLSCPSPKCLDCHIAVDCKLCVKGTQCERCKNPKEHSGIAECTS